MDHPVRLRARALAAACTLGVVSLVVPAVLSTPASAASPTASSVITTSRTAIDDQSSVHVVFVARSGSSSKQEKITADVGTHSGTERITDGGAYVTVRVTTSDAYVKGNSSGLSTILGLSSSEAQKVGTRWVYWKSGTSQYSTLKSDVTMSSVTGLLPPTKGTKLSTATVKGHSVYVLKWTEAATSSSPQLSNALQLAATGPTLPIEAVTTASGGDRATTTLSSWGEPVVVPVPSSSSTVSASKITG